MVTGRDRVGLASDAVVCSDDTERALDVLRGKDRGRGLSDAGLGTSPLVQAILIGALVVVVLGFVFVVAAVLLPDHGGMTYLIGGGPVLLLVLGVALMASRAFSRRSR